MPLTVAARTVTKFLRIYFHLCEGRVSCDQITVFSSLAGTSKYDCVRCLACTMCSFDPPRQVLFFSSSLCKFNGLLSSVNDHQIKAEMEKSILIG